jgi:hypothetical protein
MTEDHTTAGKLDSIAGWLVALSAFIAGFVAFGVMYSFGAFFRGHRHAVLLLWLDYWPAE